MKDTLQELFKQARAFVILSGAILLIIGASGGFTLGSFSLQISDAIWRSIIGLAGIVFLVFGLFLTFRESSQPRFSESSVSSGRFRDFPPGLKSHFFEKEDDDSVNLFLANRTHLPKLDALIRAAQKEIILYAVRHSYLVHHGLDLLLEKLEAGCKVKILLMAAKTPDGEINRNVVESGSHRTYPGLILEVERNTERFIEWFDSLKEATKKLVEIRVYQQFPVISLVIVDRTEPYGFIQAEILMYGVDVGKMPHYVLTRNMGVNLFEAHYKSFEKLWEESQILRSWQP